LLPSGSNVQNIKKEPDSLGRVIRLLPFQATSLTLVHPDRQKLTNGFANVMRTFHATSRFYFSGAFPILIPDLKLHRDKYRGMAKQKESIQSGVDLKYQQIRIPGR